MKATRKIIMRNYLKRVPSLLVKSAKILLHNVKVGKTSTVYGKVSVSKSLNLI